MGASAFIAAANSFSCTLTTGRISFGSKNCEINANAIAPIITSVIVFQFAFCVIACYYSVTEWFVIAEKGSISKMKISNNLRIGFNYLNPLRFVTYNYTNFFYLKSFSFCKEPVPMYIGIEVFSFHLYK
jgi:hypothetical protein